MIQLPEIDNRMWYRTYYTIPFTGQVKGEGVDYCVYIDRACTYTDPFPEVVELDGGPHPFVFSFDNSEELLPTTRVSRAQISFADDIDLSELVAETGLSWRVTLVRVADQERIFTGYLSGETYTQPYIDGVNIVTINAVSPTVPMLAEPMPIADAGMITLGEALNMMVREMYSRIEHAGRVLKYIYIPAMFTTTSIPVAEDYTLLLRLKFPAWNFVRKSEDYILTGEEYVCDTFAELINALCLFFGWTMCDIGDDCIYFVSPAHKGNYMRLTAADLTRNEAFTPTFVSPSILDQSILEAVDGGDTAECRQGVSAITIDVAGVEASAELPDINNQVQKWSLEQRSYPAEIDFFYTPFEQTLVFSYGAKKTPTLTKGDVIFPRYRCTVSQSSSGAVNQVWTELEDDDAADGSIFQGQYLESDFCNYDDTIADSKGEINKRSWSFKRIYRIEEGRLTDIGKLQPYLMAMPALLPVVKLRQRLTALHSGAIVVNFSMRATPMDGFFIPEDFYIAGGNIGNSRIGSIKAVTPEEFYQYSYYPMFWGDRDKNVTAVLKVGDMYFDGAYWQDSYRTFNIPIDVTPGEWHAVKTNKTIEMPYQGEQGFFIPITTELVGDLELWILSGLSSPGHVGAGPAGADYSNSIKLAYADIADLTLSYAQEIDYVATPAASKKYYKRLSRQFPSTTELTLPLHGRLNNSDQVSLVRYPNSEAVDKVWVGGQEKKIETYLLDEYERLYGRVIRRWRRGMDLRALLPMDLFRGDATSTSLMITGMSVDYADGTQQVYLSEVRNK